MISEHFFLEKEALFSALNDHCVRSIHDSLKIFRPSCVYLSGGSTPAPLYKKLAQSNIDFSSIQWAMVDERWVDPVSASSNQRFITACFAEAAGFRLLPMKNAAQNPTSGLSELESAYKMLPKRSTLCILGMGNDGHTASFFPHAYGLEISLDENNKHRVAAIVAKPSVITGDSIERVTLTRNTLLDSDNLILLFTGDEKFQIYQKALQENDILKTPVSAILNQDKTHVHVYWCP